MSEKIFRHNLNPLLVVLIFIFFSSLYGIARPIWEAPDEPAHYLRIRRLAEPGFSPPDFPGPWPTVWSERYLYSPYQSGQPPLYYLAAAAGVKGLDLLLSPPLGRSIFLPVRPNRREGGNVFIHPPAGLRERLAAGASIYCLRIFSIAFGALAVFLIYRIGRVVCPGEPAVALGAGGFVAALPQFNFISASITNDPAAALLGAAALLYMVGRIGNQSPAGAGYYLGLGGLLALGLLTKFNLVFLFPTALIFIALKTRQPESGINWPPALALTAAPPVLAGAAAFLLFPGEIKLKSEILLLRFFRVTPELLTADRIRHMIWTIYRSFFAFFGWMSVPVSGWLYLAWGLLGAAALIGWFRRRPESPSRPAALLAAAAVILLLGVIKNNLLVPQSQGRFLFPALGAIAPLFAIGYCRLFPARCRLQAVWVLLFALAALNLAAFFQLLGRIA